MQLNRSRNTHPLGRRGYQRTEIPANEPECLFSKQLTKVQENHKAVEIGSYPRDTHNKNSGRICISGKDKEEINAAKKEVMDMLKHL